MRLFFFFASSWPRIHDELARMSDRKAALLIAVLTVLLISGVDGYLSRQCLNCIRNADNNGATMMCEWDGSNSMRCGFFKITMFYYMDCGQPYKNANDTTESAWKKCVVNAACAELCVRLYAIRFASECPSAMATCETYARVHNGGPGGCRAATTVAYWQKVQTCLNSS